jgi:hypothetical protein
MRHRTLRWWITTRSRWLHLSRCAICGRHAGVYERILEEPATSAARGVTWRLCEDCFVAVGRELERAELRTPARVRVALGLVAAERGHRAHPSIWSERYWEQLSDRGQDRLLIWIFYVAFVVHALAFMLVAVYVAMTH